MTKTNPEGGRVKLTKAQWVLARHALGLRAGVSQSYRNRYAAAHHTDAWRAWTEMVIAGLAERRGFGIALDHFALTLAGAQAALNPGETLDVEDFPQAALLQGGGDER